MLISIYLILLYLVIMALVIAYAVYCSRCERISDANCKKYQDLSFSRYNHIAALEKSLSEKNREITFLQNELKSYKRKEKAWQNAERLRKNMETVKDFEDWLLIKLDRLAKKQGGKYISELRAKFVACNVRHYDIEITY